MNLLLGFGYRPDPVPEAPKVSLRKEGFPAPVQLPSAANQGSGNPPAHLTSDVEQEVPND